MWDGGFLALRAPFKFMSDKILVTGGTGFIGRRVCRILLERDVPVVILDSQPAQSVVEQLRQTKSDLPENRLMIVEADITDLEQVEAALQQYGEVTRIIHLASLLTAGVEENLVQGARVNVLGTVNILDVSARFGIQRVVQASSEAVYGNGQARYGERPVREEDFCGPHDHHFAYGAMKLLNEFMGSKYAATHGLSVACLRPSIVFGFGRGGGGQSWAEVFATNPAGGKPATLPFPSDNRDNWIYVDDCAEQLVRLALKPELEHYVYNSGGETVTAAELVEQVRRHLPDADISLDESKPYTPLIDDMDGSRLQREIGFRPRALSAGLLAHIDEARQAIGLAPIPQGRT
jgi:UDP-glucose 4-epimerase